MPAGAVSVRPLRPTDLPNAVTLHLQELESQFVARFGPRFLRRYYRAYLDSPYGLALAAVAGDPEVPAPADGAVLGVLLGAVNPRAHYAHLVRHDGPALAGRMALGALARPPLAAELLRTRGWRYARGTVRLLANRRGPGSPRGRGPSAPESPAGPASCGEVTVVVVSPQARGRGVGRALLDAAAAAAWLGGAARLELVTLAGEGSAAAFYERLGWQRAAGVVEHAGERYMRFELALPEQQPPRAAPER